MHRYTELRMWAEIDKVKEGTNGPKGERDMKAIRMTLKQHRAQLTLTG